MKAAPTLHSVQFKVEVYTTSVMYNQRYLSQRDATQATQKLVQAKIVASVFGRQLNIHRCSIL